MKTSYVLGFLFTTDKTLVVLIEKQKPEWQKGLLNGIGGKIEEGETNTEAMIREFKEETGVKTAHLDWQPFCQMEGDDFCVHCFKAFDNDAFNRVHTTENEKVYKVNLYDYQLLPMISNLKWLIHMALDDNYGNKFYATINYQKNKGGTTTN